MKRPEPRRKRRSSFFETLAVFFFLLVLIAAFIVGSVYVYRDRLLLEALRNTDVRKLGVEVLAVDSITTRPVGQVSVEVRGLVFQMTERSPVIRADRAVLFVPKNLLELYQLWITRDFDNHTLPVKSQLVGLKVLLADKTKSETTETATPPASPSSKIPLPFNVDLESELRDAEILLSNATDSFRLQNITGLVKTQISRKPSGVEIQNSAQLVFNTSVRGVKLPIRTDWQLVASENTVVDLKAMTLSTLGLTLKSSGQFDATKREFQFQTSGTTADLSIIPLDKKEGEALGLSGRLKGEAHVDFKASGALDRNVEAEGLLKLNSVSLPFQLERNQPKRFTLRGPVAINAEVPFKVLYDFGTKKITSLDIHQASIKADLTTADLRAHESLNKAAGVPFVIGTQVTAEGETIELTTLDLRLANLTSTAKGQISLSPKRNSKIDLTLDLPSLTGWPLMLPILGTIHGSATTSATDLNRAKGAFRLQAHVEAPLLDPMSDGQVSIESFDARDFEFPMNLPLESGKVIGLLRGDISGTGTVRKTADKLDWVVKRTQGAVDLKDLEIDLGETFKKASGHGLDIAFVASSGAPSGNDEELRTKVDKCEIRFRDSSLNIVGSFTKMDSAFVVDTSVNGRTALSQVYDLIPSLRPIRAKVPSGTMTTNLKIDGRYISEKGTMASPLRASGRIGLKAPKAVLLEVEKKSARSEKPSEDSATSSDSVPAVFKSPLFAKSKVIFDLQLDSISVKTGELKGVGVIATIADGSLAGNATVASFFGGPLKAESFQMKDLAKADEETLKFSSKGSFQNIGLSRLAEFLDPQWKTMVGGFASGSFNLQTLPFSKNSALDTTSVDGALSVKQGELSTVPLDQLINRKLSEYPLIAKLTGSKKPQIATKGVSMAIQTAYSFSKGRLTLKGFKALSPEKNELHLDGWLQKDLTTELTGQAYLANTDIGGSFRQANSDKSGRLVVPIQISGSLASPNVAVAESTLNAMAEKTVQLESGKLKKKIENKAVDAIKEELKKRGLGF